MLLTLSNGDFGATILVSAVVPGGQRTSSDASAFGSGGRGGSLLRAFEKFVHSVPIN